MLARVRKDLGCSISSFYGDPPYSEYHLKLARVAVTYLYMTNKTHIDINAQQGATNIRFLPCPTEPRVFRPYPAKKIYDVLFVGRNNNRLRGQFLMEISRRCNLVVAGPGWAGTSLKALPPVWRADFSKLCGQTKIALGLVGSNWAHLRSYFSNRLPNTLASGAFQIQTYSVGLEDMFENGKHLVWYKSPEELFELIAYYLPRDKEREAIAAEGRKEVLKNYTFDSHVAKILREGREARGA